DEIIIEHAHRGFLHWGRPVATYIRPRRVRRQTSIAFTLLQKIYCSSAERSWHNASHDLSAAAVEPAARLRGRGASSQLQVGGARAARHTGCGGAAREGPGGAPWRASVRAAAQAAHPDVRRAGIRDGAAEGVLPHRRCDGAAQAAWGRGCLVRG